MNGQVIPLSIDVARRREAQERAAAKRASTLSARRVHQELAQLYAQLTNPVEAVR